MKKLIFLFIFLFTGCWNYHELNDLAIATALAIDKKGDKYEISILIANSKKNEASTGDSGSQTIVYSGVGRNVYEALQKIDSLSPKQIYIEHLSIVIISKEAAKEGLVNVMDFFLRNSESTKRFQLALTDNAKDTIKIVNPLETFPASSISKNLKLSDAFQAKATSVLYSEFSYKLLEKGINSVIPTISIKGNAKDGSKNKSLEQTTPKATVVLDNMAILKDDKYVKTLSDTESKAINIINNKVNRISIFIPCNNDYTTIRTLDLDSKIKLIDPKKLKFKINLKLEGSVIEDTCNHDLSKNEIMTNLEKQGNKIVKKMVQKGINAAKQNKSDIFGLGNILYKKYPKIFKKYKNWDNDGFTKTNIDIDVDLKIRFKGAAKQNIKEVLNEN